MKASRLALGADVVFCGVLFLRASRQRQLGATPVAAE